VAFIKRHDLGARKLTFLAFIVYAPRNFFKRQEKGLFSWQYVPRKTFLAHTYAPGNILMLYMFQYVSINFVSRFLNLDDIEYFPYNKFFNTY
jgi:hypothetical protein